MKSLRVPVTVHEDAGIARIQEAVTIGVPLPRTDGVTDAASLALQDETGAPVPLQARVLSRWGAPVSDASAPIRFALLDFRATLSENATRTFVLTTPGTAREPGVALAREESGAIAVDTGVLTLSFSKEKPGPMRLVAGDAIGEVLSVTLEENGPQRASVVVRGELAKGFEERGGTRPLLWTMRWELTAGSRLARVQTVIENPDRPHERPFNDRGEAVGKVLGRLALEMDASGETDAKEVDAAAAPLVIVQDEDGYEARRGKTVVKKGASAAGWIAAGGTLVGMRSFAENHPKGLSAGNGTVALELFPKTKDGVFFGGSRAKTHDVWVRFPGGASVEPDEAAAIAMHPLRATVSPAWLQKTKALGTISVEDAKKWKEHEETLDRVVAADLAPRDGTIFDERRAEKAFGWMDYGDTYRDAEKGTVRRFGNAEFDFGWVLLRQYLRERDHDRVWLDQSEAVLRHLMDVDVMHTDDDAPWANHGVRKHDGNEFTGHGRGPDFSHFWVRGLLAFHLTTGDARAREVAVDEIGGWIARREDPKKPGSLVYADELRDVGWVLVALDDLYQATGDEKWLALAHRIANTMVLPSIGKDGTMRDAAFLNRKETFAPWQEAYVADGLGRLCLSLRDRQKRDAKLEAALVRMLDFLSGPAWIDEPTELYGETYPRMVAFAIDRAGKRDAGDASMTQALADPLVWGWLLFGEPKYRDAAIEANRLTFPSGAKGYYDPSITTPAKNAAVRTYFGEAARWMEQTAPRPRTAAIP